MKADHGWPHKGPRISKVHDSGIKSRAHKVARRNLGQLTIGNRSLSLEDSKADYTQI